MKKITATILFCITALGLHAQDFEKHRDSIMMLQHNSTEEYLKYKDNDSAKADKYLEESNRYYNEAVDYIVAYIIDNPKQCATVIEENLFMFDREVEILSKIRSVAQSLPTFPKELNDKIENLYRVAVSKVLIGEVAPEFTLLNVKGEKVSLSDFKGKYIWLHFWASWCAPCRAKMRYIAQNYDSIKDDDMVVLCVSFDETEKLWLDASKIDGITWVSLRNTEGFGGVVKEKYKIESLPTSFLIGKDMKIIMQNPDLKNIISVKNKP